MIPEPWQDHVAPGELRALEEWREFALCRQTDPELFFPEKGASTKGAKRVCGACEVRQECLDWAVATRQPFGVLGGLAPAERRPMWPDEGDMPTRCRKDLHDLTAPGSWQIRSSDGSVICVQCKRDWQRRKRETAA